MKTIDRQYESLSTKDMSESTQPWFDKSPVCAPIQGSQTLKEHLRTEAGIAAAEKLHASLMEPRSLHNWRFK